MRRADVAAAGSATAGLLPGAGGTAAGGTAGAPKAKAEEPMPQSFVSLCTGGGKTRRLLGVYPGAGEPALFGLPLAESGRGFEGARFPEEDLAYGLDAGCGLPWVRGTALTTAAELRTGGGKRRLRLLGLCAAGTE